MTVERTLIEGGRVVDFENHRLTRADVRIADGIISAIAPRIPPEAGERIIEAAGRIVSPGFIDAHIHIESTMLTPLEFSRSASVRGTTAVLVDPHEIANVFGRKGINLFLEQARVVPLDMYVGIPSCVPATRLEHSGASISLGDIRELLADPFVFGLAEMMDFYDIIHGAGEARAKVDTAFESGKLVDGHCPGLSGADLRSYITNGRNDGIVRIMTDHETSTPEEAAEKLAEGMRLALRYGSAERDLDRILPALVSKGADLSRCMLCSDDLSPLELFTRGHMDRAIARARDLIAGASDMDDEATLVAAIELATRNPGIYLAPFLRLAGSPPVGEIAEGYRANIVIFGSAGDLSVEMVFHGGKLVTAHGRPIGPVPGFDYSGYSESVNTGRRFQAGDFFLPCPHGTDTITANVIGVMPESILTRHLKIEMPVGTAGGATFLLADPSRDIAKIAVIERHHATGNFAVGLVQGLGIKKGAIASTITHDSHNLIVASMDDESMARAVNFLEERGGGMAVICGEERHYLPLKIAGLMSDEPLEAVAAGYRRIRTAAQGLGTGLENIFAIMSFLALPVIPELRITDMGIVDVARFGIVPLC